MMRTMNPTCRYRSRRCVVTLLLILSLAAACQAKDSSPAAPSAFPSTLLGTWQVTEVHRQQNSPLREMADYKYNIHKFLGRVFMFTPQLLTHNAVPWDSRDTRRCENPRIIVHRTTAARAVGSSIASVEKPTPRDFQLPLSDNAPIEALSLLCKDGLFVKGLGAYAREAGPSADEIRGAWLIVLNPEQLALRWDDEVFLILKRLPENDQPVASFDCTKAATATEKTICASVSLAAYDVSVAETYKFALGYYQFALETYNPSMRKQTDAQIVAFRKSQKQWLAKRDACGSNAACLDKSMGDRIWELQQEIVGYAYDNRHIR